MAFHLDSIENPNINVPRLQADLEITQDVLDRVGQLSLSSTIYVASASPIKIHTVRDSLRLMRPNERFAVRGVAAASRVDEQPFGASTLEGAMNRLRDGRSDRAGDTQAAAGTWIAIENGLFGWYGEESFDDTSYYDPYYPDTHYYDRTLSVVRLSNGREFWALSTAAESVMFPDDAVVATSKKPGGFREHTVGETMAEMGIVRNKQNPYVELTADRPGGPLCREDQMARVIIRSLLAASEQCERR